MLVNVGEPDVPSTVRTADATGHDVPAHGSSVFHGKVADAMTFFSTQEGSFPPHTLVEKPGVLVFVRNPSSFVPSGLYIIFLSRSTTSG